MHFPCLGILFNLGFEVWIFGKNIRERQILTIVQDSWMVSKKFLLGSVMTWPLSVD